MRTRSLSILAALVSTPFALLACSGDDTNPALPDAATDGSIGDASVDATTGDANAPDAGDDAREDAGDANDTNDGQADAGPMAQLRVAWFVDPTYTSGVGSARFDVCVAPHGSGGWTGPLLGASGGNGLALGEVTKYFRVEPGRYDVRVVAAGAATCNAALDAGLTDSGAPALTDFTDLPAVGDALTLVFTPPFTSAASGSFVDLIPLVDEATTAAGKVGVRFANVSGPASAAPLDYGLGGGVTFVPWFTGVSSTAHVDPAADTNGYRQVDPFDGVDTSLQQSGADLGVSDGFDTVSGSRISAFAVFVSRGGNVAAGLVACADGEVSASNPLLSACNDVSVVPPGTISGVATRFADFIADPGFTAVDICVKYDFATSWTGTPLLGAGSPGLVAGQVSKRLPFHSGALFDIRLVAAGSTTCSEAVTPDVTYFPPSTTSELATVALTGWEARPEDAGASLVDAGADAAAGGGLSTLDVSSVALEDLACGESAPVVRVVNMAGADAQPLTATLTAGANGWSFANVPYGGFLTTVPHDACGYLDVSSEMSGVLDVAGGAWTYDLTTTSTDTLYLYSSGGQVEVLACDDGDATASACAPLVAAP
jgi:hypothetical protein